MATKIPTGIIDVMIDRQHVSASDETVKADLESRMTDPRFTPAIKRACIKYALKRHSKNRDLYRRVMTGDLGTRRRRQ